MIVTEYPTTWVISRLALTDLLITLNESSESLSLCIMKSINRSKLSETNNVIVKVVSIITKEKTWYIIIFVGEYLVHWYWILQVTIVIPPDTMKIKDIEWIACVLAIR